MVYLVKLKYGELYAHLQIGVEGSESVLDGVKFNETAESPITYSNFDDPSTYVDNDN